MYISSNHTATSAKYAQSILSDPKIKLSNEQRQDVETLAKKHTSQIPDEFAQASALSSLSSNPYNPFYGVSEPINPYNYSSNPNNPYYGTNKQPSAQINLNVSKNLSMLQNQLDTKQRTTWSEFNLLRSQL